MKYLQSKSGIAGGELTIKDTRIRIAHVLSNLANGITIEEMLTGWPWLSKEALSGAIHEAAKQLEARPAQPQAHA